MKVLETYIVRTGDNDAYSTLHKCDNGKPAGRWFVLTAGAFGTTDMKLKPVGPKKAAEWIAAIA